MERALEPILARIGHMRGLSFSLQELSLLASASFFGKYTRAVVPEWLHIQGQRREDTDETFLATQKYLLSADIYTMQVSAAQARCSPASTSGRTDMIAEGHIEGCLRPRRAAIGVPSSQRTLLLRRRPLRGQRCLTRSQLGASLCGSRRQHAELSTCSRSIRRDVAVGARSIAGQVGVAAVEEVVEAQHAELMSFAALPRHLASQRDSLLSLQNVESLTDELAQLSQDLERLTTSEAASISDSPVGTLIIAFLSIRDTQLGRSLLCVRVACSSCSKGEEALLWAGGSVTGLDTGRMALSQPFLLLNALMGPRRTPCSHPLFYLLC